MIELIQGGSVTSAKGFAAGATYAGIKTSGDGSPDLGVLVSDVPAAAAGMFSTSKVLSPSVTLTKQRVAKGATRAVVANSGCANCCVGEQGLKDAEEMASLTAGHISVSPDDVLVCSTGLIGVELPMALVRQNIGNIELAEQGGHQFARAIMTTDSHPKQMAISLDVAGSRVILGGAAKGSAMVHPNMATMLCFITTDAPVEQTFLQQALRESVGASFNMIDVDGDQSTNDTLLVLANGQAGGTEVGADSPAAGPFQEALTYICTDLAKELVRDGEGAQRLIEVVVEGARTPDEARFAAREIASSVLVKAMVHGRDPNWGKSYDGPGQERHPVRRSRRGPVHQRHPYRSPRAGHPLSQGRRHKRNERAGGPVHGQGKRGGRERHRLGMRPHGRVCNAQLRIQHLART